MNNRSTITGVLMCCMLCCVTLFIYSNQFVNKEVTPKWLCMMLFISIMGMIWSIWRRKISLPARPVDTILIVCIALVFSRSWITSGALLMYPVGLLLLFFLIQYAVKTFQLQYLYGTVTFFALALSLHGILQYVGVLSTTNSNFAVTGNFDNPAGFAAALACALPFCFLFFANNRHYVIRYAAMTAATLMAIVIVLSGSRAGILAAAVATAIYFFLPQSSQRISQGTQRREDNLANFTVKLSELCGRKWKKKLYIPILAIVMFVLSVALYFFKKDSADGRLLIWRCTWNMVADKPVFGHGQGAFQAKYMLYQADYFNTHPDSQYAPLADNTLHPFNEYLLVLAEHGFVGLCAVALLAFLLIVVYRHNRSNEKLPAMLSLLALAVFAFFSYPFKYPFTWILLFLNMAIVCNPSNTGNVYVGFFAQKRNILYRNMPRIVVFLLSAVLTSYTVMLTQAEIAWKRIAHHSLAGQTVKVLPEYDQLYQWLGKDGLFLYNHAAELHEARKFEHSIAVFERCTRYFNDMDVQMLLADNYKELELYAEAERHLKMAAAMCPARFMPLYELVKLYDAADRKDEAIALARKITEKSVKIPSFTVTAIKNEMRKLIEENDNLTNDKNENR